MNWNKVESSNIEALAYEGDQLFVKFHNGRVYSYESVTIDTFSFLLKAESVGRTFNQTIKVNPTIYPCTRLQ